MWQHVRRADTETTAGDEAAPSPWSRAGLSVATQQALAGSRTQQGYPRSSPFGRKGSSYADAVEPPMGRSSSRHASNNSLAGMDTKGSQGAAVQQSAKGGLDQIFARMSPGADDDSPDRIDDDSKDGNLLGGQDDSLYGSHYSWKRDKR